MTQVQNQLMQTRQQEQMATQIKAHTQVIQAEYAKKAKVIRAQGLANYTLITKTAHAEALQNKTDVEAEMMALLEQRLGMVGDALVTYQRYAAINELGNSTVFYGFEGSTQMMVPAQGNPHHAFFR